LKTEIFVGIAKGEEMNFEHARKIVEKRFPYDGYMDISNDSYVNITNTITKYLKPKARILDFGSGPCDKTAIIQQLGYQCSAFDDLGDDWHLVDGNREKIIDFAKSFEIDFRLASDGYLPFDKNSFDMVMAHDVLEHLHDSPQALLNDLAELIKPNGFLFITVPSAVNIKKRIEVFFGKTNLPDFSTYYWSKGSWRGHVREYVYDDLKMLSEYLGFKIEELHGCHHMLHLVPKSILPLYLAITKILPNLQDSWLLVARKPDKWEAKRNLSDQEYSKLIGKYSPYYTIEP
jgi:SAM-dependent methyltransferase